MVRPYKVRIYSAADPPCWSHRSSNAYIARCCCRSKPNENSQFPREPSNSKSVVLYKRRWDETLMLGERQRFITQSPKKVNFRTRTEKSSQMAQQAAKVDFHMNFHQKDSMIVLHILLLMYVFFRISALCLYLQHLFIAAALVAQSRFGSSF
jgi:hypothetical protein